MIPLLFFSLTACVGVVLIAAAQSRGAGAVIIRELLSEDRRSQPRADPSPVFYGDPQMLSAVAGGLLLFGLSVVLGVSDVRVIVCSGVLGVSIGALWWKRRKHRRAREIVRESERHLPMAMERIVMAVGAGLDILPALAEAGRDGTDPVSQGLGRIVALAEGGLPVEDAMRVVSEASPSPAVKHALIHLHLAHRQGGEVIRPLKELSDATQISYQELVDEEIAKLPVKAVLPLILTFAGLIICFLTIPLVQIGSIAGKVTYATR